VDFVKRVATPGSKDFVPEPERIATFDNDGTLWAEQPLYFQFAFALDRVQALAPQHPEWKEQQPFKAVLEGDLKTVFASGEHGLGDIVYLSQPSDWKVLVTTPNNSMRYVYSNFNTQPEGPVVLEVPAAVGAGVFGSMVEAWQVPLADVGPEGEDQGKGGKYLLPPPDFKGDVPASYFAVRSQTYNGYALLRAISQSSSEADVAKAIALVKQVRLYPLSKAANPPPTRFVDVFGVVFDGIVRYDESFYASLA